MDTQIPDIPLNVDLENLNQTCRAGLVERLGIHYIYVGTARAEATMPVDERTCQPFGILHGGASMALAETIAGVGSLSNIAADEHAVGQQVSVNHVSAATKGDTVHAVATLVHRGRSSHVWHVDITSQSTGKLVCTAQVLYCILKK
ncbi:MAG: PaaI family thioesterase [Bacteroidaceae bacterium]|nr:PaaI family thioesterase [Bacteroidaceae bacterium]